MAKRIAVVFFIIVGISIIGFINFFPSFSEKLNFYSVLKYFFICIGFGILWVIVEFIGELTIGKWMNSDSVANPLYKRLFKVFIAFVIILGIGGIYNWYFA